MPKNKKTARSARALVGGLYPAASASQLPPATPSRRLLLWAHEDGELLDRRLLRPGAEDPAAVLDAIERFQARDGALPERVVLNSKRLLELSRAALGDRVNCDEGATPQTDRAAASLVSGAAPPASTKFLRSPGVQTDVGIDCLACFFDHAHALFERCPWRALDGRFEIMRLDLGDLGWPRAILELRRGSTEDAGLVLHPSLFAWRRSQQLRRAGSEDAEHPPRLELLRVAKSALDPRLRALMEEFGWLAPVSLQPSPRSHARDGSPCAPSTQELQLLSAAAIVLERLLHMQELSSGEGKDSGFVGATVEVEDELWRARVEVAAPPAALRGVSLHPEGDPSFAHILRCFACALDEDDRESARLLSAFRDFAERAYARSAGEKDSRAGEVFGVEWMLIYLTPFLAGRFLCRGAAPEDSFDRALGLSARMSRWLVQSRLIQPGAWEEYRRLFESRRPELLRAAALLRSTESDSPETPRPHLRAVVELLRVSDGRAWFRGVDGRGWGPIDVQRDAWLARVERGWKLDLVFHRSRGQLAVARLEGIYPDGVAPLRPRAGFETSL